MIARVGWLVPVVLVALVVLPSCESDGCFTFCGYSTKPNYDLSFKTIRVPIFRNRTYWTVTPIPGMEQQLTKAVVREIEQRTPYKVVQGDADTELLGTIVNFYELQLNAMQLGYPREVETDLIVELLWRDRRTGKILTKPARRPGVPLPAEKALPLLPSDEVVTPGSRPPAIISPPGLPTEASGVAGSPSSRVGASPRPVGPDGVPIIPVVVRSVAFYRPELGESLASALWQNYTRMGIRITEVMEVGW
jgi:hypothetical protein